MMFRERRGKHTHVVLCIRTKYDKSKKRGVQEVAASFSPHAAKIPSEELEKLTPDERKEAEQWLADRRVVTSQYTAKGAGPMADTYMNSLASALEDPERAPLTLELLNPAAIYKAIDRLTKALKKNKIARPAADKTSDSQPTAATEAEPATDAENLSA